MCGDIERIWWFYRQLKGETFVKQTVEFWMSFYISSRQGGTVDHTQNRNVLSFHLWDLPYTVKFKFVGYNTLKQIMHNVIYRSWWNSDSLGFVSYWETLRNTPDFEVWWSYTFCISLTHCISLMHAKDILSRAQLDYQQGKQIVFQRKCVLIVTHRKRVTPQMEIKLRQFHT